MKLRISGAAATALVAAILACGSAEREPAKPAAPATPAPEPAAPPPAPSQTAETKAQQIFISRCAVCHGPQGAGDGPGSAGLSPPPRDFRDAQWQASVSDEHIAKIVVQGGPAVGKSPLMPPNPDLTGQPEVVAALVTHIRSLEN